MEADPHIVLRSGTFIQVCVPDEWETKEIEDYFNKYEPCGSKWKRDWTMWLSSCSERKGYQHLILDSDNDN